MLHVLTSSGFVEFKHPPAEERPSRWLIGIASASREYATCRRIEDLGIDVYLPFKIRQRRVGRNRVIDVVEPIFRTYFFVPGWIGGSEYHQIKRTPGVFDFLQIDGRAAVIPDHELNRARYQEVTFEQKRRKRILESGKGKHFIVGEPVSVNVGFAIMDATVHAVGAKRVRVELCDGLLFGKKVVEVDLGHLTRRQGFIPPETEDDDLGPE